MAERTSALKKVNFRKDSDSALWTKVLIPEMMSSEESDMDEEEVLKVHTYPWRSSKVSRMFKQLDIVALKDKTPQSRRQRKRRTVGECSGRERPTEHNLPNWVFS